MQEFSQSGLDASLPIFAIVAFTRFLSYIYLVDSVKGDPVFKYNALAYWVLIVMSLLGYEAAYTTYFVDVPRLIEGTQSAIEYSKGMHDSIAQFWRYTSILPLVPGLFGLISIVRSRSSHISFGLARLLPVFFFDLIICVCLFVFPI